MKMVKGYSLTKVISFTALTVAAAFSSGCIVGGGKNDAAPGSQGILTGGSGSSTVSGTPFPGTAAVRTSKDAATKYKFNDLPIHYGMNTGSVLMLTASSPYGDQTPDFDAFLHPVYKCNTTPPDVPDSPPPCKPGFTSVSVAVTTACAADKTGCAVFAPGQDIDLSLPANKGLISGLFVTFCKSGRFWSATLPTKADDIKGSVTFAGDPTADNGKVTIVLTGVNLMVQDSKLVNKVLPPAKANLFDVGFKKVQLIGDLPENPCPDAGN